jgi:hypothetical protein
LITAAASKNATAGPGAIPRRVGLVGDAGVADLPRTNDLHAPLFEQVYPFGRTRFRTEAPARTAAMTELPAHDRVRVAFDELILSL